MTRQRKQKQKKESVYETYSTFAIVIITLFLLAAGLSLGEFGEGIEGLDHVQGAVVGLEIVDDASAEETINPTQPAPTTAPEEEIDSPTTPSAEETTAPSQPAPSEPPAESVEISGESLFDDNVSFIFEPDVDASLITDVIEGVSCDNTSNCDCGENLVLKSACGLINPCQHLKDLDSSESVISSTCTGDFGLSINSSDTTVTPSSTLDCRGLTINGERGSNTVGLLLQNLSGLATKITNCEISSFEVGIKIENVSHVSFENITVTNNSRAGIIVHNSTNISFIFMNASNNSGPVGANGVYGDVIVNHSTLIKFNKMNASTANSTSLFSVTFTGSNYSNITASNLHPLNLTNGSHLNISNNYLNASSTPTILLSADQDISNSTIVKNILNGTNTITSMRLTNINHTNISYNNFTTFSRAINFTTNSAFNTTFKNNVIKDGSGGDIATGVVTVTLDALSTARNVSVIFINNIITNVSGNAFGLSGANATLIGNNVTNVDGNCLVLQNRNHTVRANRFINCTQNGIHIKPPVTNSTFRRNTIIDNDFYAFNATTNRGDGIHVVNSLTFEDNTFENNSRGGINFENVTDIVMRRVNISNHTGVGIQMVNSSNMSLADTIFYNNSGIDITLQSDTVKIYFDTLTINASDMDIRIDSLSNASFHKLNFTNEFGALTWDRIINVSKSTTLATAGAFSMRNNSINISTTDVDDFNNTLNVTFRGLNASFNGGANVSKDGEYCSSTFCGTVSSSGGTFSTLLPTFGANSFSIFAHDRDEDNFNFSRDCNDNNETQAPIVNSSSGFYTLNASRTICAGEYNTNIVLNIQGPRQVIDCNNTAVKFRNTSLESTTLFTIGLTGFSNENATIKGCLISGYDTAFSIGASDQTNNINISGNFINNTQTSVITFSGSASGNYTFEKNRIENTTSSTDSLIAVSGDPRNLIFDNNNISGASGASIYGMSIGAENVTITNNRFFNNTAAICLSATPNITIANNTFFENKNAITSICSLSFFPNTTIADNVFYDNIEAINLSHALDNFLTNVSIYRNIIDNNTKLGIQVGNVSGINITANNISSNPLGILILDSINNSPATFVSNRIVNSSDAGIKISNRNSGAVAENMTFVSNEVINGSEGILVINSDHNEFVENNITTNTFGINVSFALNNSFSRNLVRNQTRDQVWVFNSSNTSFISNNISGGSMNCTVVYKAVNNSFQSNIISGCAGHGVLLLQSNRTNFTLDRIVNNSLDGIALKTSHNSSFINVTIENSGRNNINLSQASIGTNMTLVTINDTDFGLLSASASNASFLNLSYVNVNGTMNFVQFSINNATTVNTTGRAFIRDDRFTVDSDNLTMLNTLTQITKHNVTFDLQPTVLQDNSSCSDTQCLFESYSGDIFSFSVIGFTNYTVSSNALLDIFDSEDLGTVPYVNNPVTFYANYTNASNGSFIDTNLGGSCTIMLNTAGPFAMTSINNLYNYTATPSGGGVSRYNVTCTGSVDFEQRNASSTINVLSPSSDEPSGSGKSGGGAAAAPAAPAAAAASAAAAAGAAGGAGGAGGKGSKDEDKHKVEIVAVKQEGLNIFQANKALLSFRLKPNKTYKLEFDVVNTGKESLNDISLVFDAPPSVEIVSVKPKSIDWIEPRGKVTFMVGLKTKEIKEGEKITLAVTARQTKTEQVFTIVPLAEDKEKKALVAFTQQTKWNIPLGTIALTILSGSGLLFGIQWFRAKQLEELSESALAFIFRDIAADSKTVRQLGIAGKIKKYHKLFVTHGTYMRFKHIYGNLRPIPSGMKQMKKIKGYTDKYKIGMELATLLAFSGRRKLLAKMKPVQTLILTMQKIPEDLEEDFDQVTFANPFAAAESKKEKKKQKKAPSIYQAFLFKGQQPSERTEDVKTMAMESSFWKRVLHSLPIKSKTKTKAITLQSIRLDKSRLRKHGCKKELASYILNALAAGAAYQDIRQVLTKAKWKPKIVDHALQAVQKETLHLEQYIRHALLTGGSLAHIRRMAKKKGYSIPLSERLVSMVKKDLADIQIYIVREFARQTKEDIIAVRLQSAGWEEQECELLLHHAKKEFKSFSLYLDTLIKRGYTLPALEQSLVNNDFDKQAVRDYWKTHQNKVDDMHG